MAGSARLALDDLDVDLLGRLVDERELVPVLTQRLQRLGKSLRVLEVGLDQPVRDDEVRRGRTEVRAQAGRPALELVQRLREARVLGLGQLLGLAATGADVDVLDLLANEQILEQ